MAVPLLYSAGPQALEYAVATTTVSVETFLAAAFVSGRGFFGYRNHSVSLVEGSVVGVVAVYPLTRYIALSLQHAWQVWRHFGLPEFMPRMRRGVQLQSLMPPPGLAMVYLANFGVAPQWRGHGVGRAMLERQVDAAKRRGYRVLALDVSVENPRARELYERCGLRVVSRNRFAGPEFVVPDTLRMELAL